MLRVAELNHSFIHSLSPWISFNHMKTSNRQKNFIHKVLNPQHLSCINSEMYSSQVCVNQVCVNSRKFYKESLRSQEQIIFFNMHCHHFKTDINTDSCWQLWTRRSSVSTFWSLPSRHIQHVQTTDQIKMGTSLEKEELLGLFVVLWHKSVESERALCAGSKKNDLQEEPWSGF